MQKKLKVKVIGKKKKNRRKKKGKKKENSTELQKPSIDIEVCNNNKDCD